MEVLNVRQTRENLSKIFKSGKIVEVNHPTHPVVIVPKEKFQDMEDELMMLQMDIAEAKSKRKYTTEEVEAMIGQIREKKYG